MQDSTHLVWIDMEMTGLDAARDVVLEIATLITTSDLDVVAEGPVLAVHQPDAALALMDDWNVRTHTGSGLVERVKASTVTVSDAETQTLEFLRAWTPEGASPLCGNSVHQDRRFLRRYLPALDAYLHYRILDVSTIKELAARWYPALTPPPKREVHRALDDIRESVAELRWYRERIFRPIETVPIETVPAAESAPPSTAPSGPPPASRG